MLDWLKNILGDNYTDEIDKKVSEEIGKGFVARSDFNTLNTEKKQLADSLKERDAQLATLQASTGNVEELKKQITDLQTQNSEQAKTHAAELNQLKIDNAVDIALAAAKAKNPKAVKALLELEKAELASDGTVKGLDDQIKKLTEAPDSNFMFEVSANPQNPAFKGLQPAEGGDNPAAAGGKKPSEMTYQELADYLDANPGIVLKD